MTKKKTTAKKTTTTEPAVEKKEELLLCGDCNDWLETNDCSNNKSPCHGGVVNKSAMACEHFNN